MMEANAADTGMAWRLPTRYGRTTSPARGITSPVMNPTVVAEKRSRSRTRASGASRYPHRQARVR